MKHVTLFDTHSEYEIYRDSEDYITPNVSYCKDLFDIHYNYIVIIAIFNVTSTSDPTTILNSSQLSSINEIKIDNVIQPNIISSYTFDTTGEHTIRYKLVNNKILTSAIFYNCDNLVSIIVPNTVKTIEDAAFSNCNILSDITIPNSVTIINQYAFLDCINLTELVIPDSVTSIGTAICYRCSNLETVILSNNISTILAASFMQCKIKNLIIPDSVTSIGNSAFNSCQSLETVVIGSGVTSLDGSAFYNCTSLQSITIKATTPPTLTNSSALSSTNNCPIYVHELSVDTYKAASGWSDYASRIRIDQSTVSDEVG